MTMMDIQVLCDQMAIPKNGQASQLDQLRHRINLISSWKKGGASFEGAQIIDIGCGQGDQTVALLGINEVRGVLGIDPGPPDYGSPFTLAQAQGKLLASPLFQHRVSFMQGNTVELLPNFNPGFFQTAIFSHCLWYFPSEKDVKASLAALKKAKVRNLAIAEWSIQVSRMEAIPHLLAALTHSLNNDKVANIRCMLSPIAIKRLALEAGWKLSHEELLPSPKVKDGQWEVEGALAMMEKKKEEKKEEKKKEEWMTDEKEIKFENDIAIIRHLQALESSVATLDSTKDVQTMDVWVAVFC